MEFLKKGDDVCLAAGNLAYPCRQPPTKSVFNLLFFWPSFMKEDQDKEEATATTVVKMSCFSRD